MPEETGIWGPGPLGARFWKNATWHQPTGMALLISPMIQIPIMRVRMYFESVHGGGFKGVFKDLDHLRLIEEI
jgi:hypothetical protein